MRAEAAGSDGWEESTVCRVLASEGLDASDAEPDCPPRVGGGELATANSRAAQCIDEHALLQATLPSPPLNRRQHIPATRCSQAILVYYCMKLKRHTVSEPFHFINHAPCDLRIGGVGHAE